jgi:hypothetical protein
LALEAVDHCKGKVVLLAETVVAEGTQLER